MSLQTQITLNPTGWRKHAAIVYHYNCIFQRKEEARTQMSLGTSPGATGEWLHGGKSDLSVLLHGKWERTAPNKDRYVSRTEAQSSFSLCSLQMCFFQNGLLQGTRRECRTSVTPGPGSYQNTQLVQSCGITYCLGEDRKTNCYTSNR